MKRAFQRELGRKPTLIQKMLTDRAAIMTAKAEAALDPSVTPNDIVRLDNAAKKARAEMFAAITATKRSVPTKTWREIEAEARQRMTAGT